MARVEPTSGSEARRSSLVMRPELFVSEVFMADRRQ